MLRFQTNATYIGGGILVCCIGHSLQAVEFVGLSNDQTLLLYAGLLNGSGIVVVNPVMKSNDVLAIVAKHKCTFHRTGTCCRERFLPQQLRVKPEVREPKSYVSQTPLEDWFSAPCIGKSVFLVMDVPVVHVPDVLKGALTCPHIHF